MVNVLERMALERVKGGNTQLVGGLSQVTPDVNSRVWYSPGVKPILISDIVKQKGAKDARTIHDFVFHGKIFSEKAGTEIAVYPTTTNLSVLYDEKTEDYVRTLDEIKKDRFNLIASQPFRVYDVRTLIKEPETCDLESEVKRILSGGRVYIISSKPSGRDFFIIAEEYAQWFVPRYSNGTKEERAERIEKFKARIREHYSAFKNWVPPNK